MKTALGHFLFFKNLLLIILVLISQNACGRFQSNKKIRISAHVWPGYEPLFYADANNFWDKDKVRLIEFNSAAQSLRAFQNGVVDMAALTLDETLILVSQGEQVEIITLLDYSNGGDAMIAQSHIKSLKELRGKRIGYENSALGAYLLGTILDHAKINTEAVELIPVESGDHADTFLKGTVHAILTFEPNKSLILEKTGRVLFDTSQIPEEIVDILVVRKSMVANERAAVQSVVSALQRVNEELAANPEKVIQAMAAHESLTPERFKIALSGVRIVQNQESLRILKSEKFRQLVKRTHLSMVKSGMLADTHVNLDFINTRFLENTGKTNGP